MNQRRKTLPIIKYNHSVAGSNEHKNIVIQEQNYENDDFDGLINDLGLNNVEVHTNIRRPIYVEI
jgi:hypothetical protein